MDAHERCAALAAELADDVGLEDLAFDEAGTLSLLIDEDRLLHFVVDADADDLALMTRVLEAEDLTAERMRAVLRAQFAWLSTGDAQFAIEPSAGALILQRRLALDGLDYPGLRAAIDALLELAEATAGADEPAADLEPSNTDMAEGGIADLAARLNFRA